MLKPSRVVAVWFPRINWKYKQFIYSYSLWLFTTWSPSNGFTICNQRWRTLKRQVIILSEFFNQQKWKTFRWKSIQCKAFGLWMSDNRGWHVFNRCMSVESDTIIYIFRQISKLSSVRFVIFEIQCNY